MAWFRVMVVCGVLLALCGCGSHEFPTAPVTGVVQCEGSPVSSGTITFTPIAEDDAAVPGKSATGKVGPDGRFVLTTYKAGDGAIIGMHNVFYTPAILGEGEERDEDEDGGSAPTPAAEAAKPLPKGGKPLPCQFGGKATMGVVEGKNDLTVNLTSWLPGKEEEEEEQGE